MTKSDKPVNLGRHQRKCSICASPQRSEIEEDFVTWNSPAAIATEYGIKDRKAIYRHARALGLLAKRQKNVRAALEHLIERARDVEATAPAVVAAVQAYAKINAAGQWIERSEQVNLNDFFDRMTTAELEAYAKSGVLPSWFERATLNTPERTLRHD